MKTHGVAKVLLLPQAVLVMGEPIDVERLAHQRPDLKVVPGEKVPAWLDRIFLRRLDGWRFCDEELGSFAGCGLPHIRGKLLATNGVLCIVRLQGTNRIFVGHLSNFEKDGSKKHERAHGMPVELAE